MFHADRRTAREYLADAKQFLRNNPVKALVIAAVALTIVTVITGCGRV